MQGFGYALTELGVTVNGQSSSILSVLVLGAGTDYALLLVSRYREELRKHEDKHEALADALRTAGPGDLRLRHDGDRRAAGALDRRGQRHVRDGPDRRDGHRGRDALDAHVPARPAGRSSAAGRSGAPRSSAGTTASPTSATTGADETHGTWRRVGERVARSPARGSGSRTAAILVVCCFGDPELLDRPQRRQLVRRRGRVRRGPGAARQGVPAGRRDPDRHRGARRVQGARRSRAPSAASTASRRSGPPRRATAACCWPPRSTSTRTPRRPRRRSSRSARPRARRAARTCWSAGQTAIQLDGREAATRDTLVIVPIALVDRVPDPDGAAAGRARPAAADRDGDPVLRRGARRERRSSTTWSSASRARTRRCRCTRSCSWWRWASTTTSS